MSERLCSIFTTLEPRDTIETKVGIFVICRLIELENTTRYMVAQLCICGEHCRGILSHSYAWDTAKQAFCDTGGEPLPGWDQEVTVDRDSYNGTDKDVLEFVLVREELPPPFDDSDEARRLELAILARTLREVVNLAPDERTAWYSAMTVLGAQMSETQLLALSGSFTPSPKPGLLLMSTFVGAVMAAGMLHDDH